MATTDGSDPSRQPPATRRPVVTRRAAIGMGGAALAAAALAGTGPDPAHARTIRRPSLAASDRAAVAEGLRPEIRPRSDWGADAPPTGEIAAEDDVRFLLVHHTASSNDYGPDQVADQIRSFHALHTGPEKGWPDVAYNFFVDRFGGIWEARAGSIDGPVRGDATGGSQGFALLCSLIGNHAEVPVSPEAQASMTALLAWLAERHDIDTAPGATVDFTSRGSNRWPAGEVVTARTISGHRDMSNTACPGDFAFGLLDTAFPEEVTRLRAAATPSEIPPSSDGAESTTTSAAPPTTTAAPPSSTSPASSTAVDGDSAAGPVETGPGRRLPGPLAALAAAGAAVFAAVAVRFGAKLER